MKRAMQKNAKWVGAILGLALVASGVGGYILKNQRFTLPKWVPVLGSDFAKYKAELTTSQSITPGQGQTVNIAGVPVGELSNVELVDGRAVVTLKIRRKYAPLYKDASAIVRPKTGLNDMIVELNPGTKAAGELSEDEPIAVSRTLPNINADEILASLDGDTRSYLQLLVGAAGEGLGGNGKRLSAAIRRFEPTARDTDRITRVLATRRENVRRVIHNFRLVSEAVGNKDKDLAELVDSSGAVFRAFANQDARLREALQLLPDTLGETRTALAKADLLAGELGPTLRDLRPAARALGPALKATRPFLRDTTPVIRDQLRPFARDVLPTIKVLRPAARDLAVVAPKLTSVLKTANYLLNTLAYNPPGDAEEGYLFWASWANQAAGGVFGLQDAHGPIRRGLIQLSCSSLASLDAVKKVNPALGTLVDIVQFPLTSEVCPTTSQAGTGTIPPLTRSAQGGGE
jgi:phospholipid/cholesterol/gamma-HCH transport system substrate-binding protein